MKSKIEQSRQLYPEKERIEDFNRENEERMVVSESGDDADPEDWVGIDDPLGERGKQFIAKDVRA